MFGFSIFGKKNKPAPKPSDAIEKLQSTLDMLGKRETHIEKQIDVLKKSAKNILASSKPRALALMKRAKLFEKEYDNIVGQKLNLEAQISTLAQAVTNSETITAMRIGKDTLASLEGKLDVDKVSDVMDELAENMNKIEEISEMMSRSVGSSYMDDDELLHELDVMSLEDQSEVPDIKVPKRVDIAGQLPNVPISTAEEDELKELEAMMNA